MNFFKVSLSIVACLFFLKSNLYSQAADSLTTKPIDLLWSVKIPMRDGVKLNATVYKPKGNERYPILFVLTPYVSDFFHGYAYYFSQNGYVFVLVDVRGRGNSQGAFSPLIQEAKDGYDLVEWLAKQPWSNGSVAMWGGSYMGYDQWATAKEFPPSLKTIVPAAAAMPSMDFPFYKNIWYPYDMQWIMYTGGVTSNLNLFSETSFWIEKFREVYKSHLAFDELDTIVSNPSPIFQTWLAHSGQDSYWDACNPTDEQFSRINLPILTITGDYDGDQIGAMEFYRRHMKFASAEATANHYLIIGPWDHLGAVLTPKKEVGGLTFGDASVLDMNKLHKEWYDWILKSGKKPEFLKKRVAYYVVGKDEWKYADSLGEIGAAKERFYLDSDGGKANDVFRSGYLADTKAARSVSDTFTYNPLDIRPGELEKTNITNYITDERYALNLFGNGLAYHTDPFADSTEVSGYVRLVLWMSMDVPDADFEVLLYEIKPDGTSILLTSDMVRARFRESLRTERLITPGQILKYEFSGFTWFSRFVAKGSRLRLVIHCPNSIYYQKNYCSGKNVMEETGRDARTAHITLYHDAAHPSCLEIPIVK